MGEIIRFFPKIFPEIFLRILCLRDHPPFLTQKTLYMGGIREGGGGNTHIGEGIEEISPKV